MASPWTLEQIDKLEQSGQLSPETAKAARSKVVPLSADQQASVANYIKSDPVQQQTDQLVQANTNDPFLRSMHGEGDFRDTGRKSDGLGESIDSVLGVPARVLANEIVQGKATPESFAKAVQSVGTDPRNAPTGHNIAVNAGVSEKPMFKAKGSTLANIASHIPGVGHFVNAAKNFMSKEVADREFEPSPADVLGTAIDFTAQVPVATMGKVAGGVVGAVRKIAPELKEAQAILSKIDTAEKAVALKGADKEAYMNALDQVYGPREQRAKDLGFGEETWYHGTQTPHKPKGIEKFSLKHAGDRTGTAHGNPSVFASSNPSIASDYAKLDDVDSAASNASREGNTVYPVRVSGENVEFPEINMEGYNEGAVTDALSSLEPGYNAHFPNMADAMSFSKDKTGQTIAVPSASRIRSTNAMFDPRFSDSPLLLAAKTGISSIDDFNTIAKTEQIKKFSKAGTLAQEGYTFGRNYKDDGVEIVAKWRGKEVGKAVITKDGVSHSQVDSLHKGKGIDEELVRFGSTENLSGKTGAGDVKRVPVVSQIDHAWDESGKLLSVHAVDSNNDVLGIAEFKLRDGKLVPESVNVREDRQRKGIASSLYDHAENMSGKEVVPSARQTPQAKALWNARNRTKLLSKIDTPEKAAALKGAQREEYLKALDEAYGPREQRAKDLGFGDETYYHGTSEQVPFDSMNTGDKGSFVTKSPEFADKFNANMPWQSASDSGQTLPLRIKDSNIFDPDAPENVEKALGTVTKNKQNAKLQFEESKDKHAGWSNIESPKAQKAIRDSKFDGYQAWENGEKNTAVFDAKNMRSTNAAFDPRFKDSSNLLAGQAGPIPRYLMPMSEDEEDDFLDEAASTGNDADLENYLIHILNQRGQ